MTSNIAHNFGNKVNSYQQLQGYYNILIQSTKLVIIPTHVLNHLMIWCTSASVFPYFNSDILNIYSIRVYLQCIFNVCTIRSLDVLKGMLDDRCL